jgi:hypothetical protein
MRRPTKKVYNQFTLSLHRDPSLQLDEPRKEELLSVLADLMREALGADSVENEGEKEKADESKDHA